MGTIITLDVGNITVGWGRNEFYTYHGQLFRPTDLVKDPEGGEMYSRRLGDLVPRLDLLGFSLDAIARDHHRLSWDREGIDSFIDVPIEQLIAGFKTLDARTTKAMDIAEAVFYATKKPDAAEKFDPLSHETVPLHDWAALRLLAENPKNRDLMVQWKFSELVEAGWAKREFFDPELPQKHKFLLVTEGTSDSAILRKAFELFRPDVADFFNFVDMESGYPFTGTGNMYRFCQGLVGIGIENKILVIYDNDTEGCSKLDQTLKLRLPPNMHAMKLPALQELRTIETLGPNGSSTSDINEAASAIECFLDFKYKTATSPVVRWTAFNSNLGRYQGELVGKDGYTKKFLDLRRPGSGYDSNKLMKLLDAICKECTEIASKLDRHSF